MQIFLKQIIAEFGYCEVMHCCSNGKTALQFLKNNKPDLILLDLEMPQIDGITFLETIQNCINIPIIIVSAYVDYSKVLHEAMNLGASDYVSIPISDSFDEFEKFKASLFCKIHKNIMVKNLQNLLKS